MPNTPGLWNLLARRYARQPVADEAAYLHKLQYTRAHLPANAQVLEIGCGTGSTALWHAPHAARITGIDFSAKMIAICREKAAAAGALNVEFRQADVRDLEGGGRYDAVLAMSILHLLEDKEAAIARVFALLKPGGMFFSSTVCIGPEKWLPRLVLPIGSALRLLPLVRCFSEDELEASLAAAGFAVTHRWQPGPGRAVFFAARKPG